MNSKTHDRVNELLRSIATLAVSGQSTSDELDELVDTLDLIRGDIQKLDEIVDVESMDPADIPNPNAK